ncbi:hypothetical protein Q5752_000124 [Cryptotrichosporon argae]
MGREIVSISVGQAGNQVGSAFWEQVIGEHGLDGHGKYIGSEQQQLDKINVYFDEAANRKYVPRSIQVDLEPGVLDNVRAGALGKLFRPDTFVHGNGGAGNNWAKGHYTEGAELIDPIMDVVRAHSEKADLLQGFQLLHSLGGGTGAGLGALLLSKIHEEYPERMLATFSVYPSPKVSETVVEPYNAILSNHMLLDNSDFTCCIDNEALYQICVQDLKVAAPQYSDLNRLIAKVMVGFTSTLRFPGLLNSDLRKLATNMVPFPRVHFFVAGYAPLIASAHRAYTASNVADLTTALFQRRSLLAAIDPLQGKYLTVSLAYRGRLGMSDIENAVYEYQNKQSAHFVPFIPNSALTSLCTVPPVGQTASATLVANTTAIASVFKRSHAQFRALYKRRAFMHWYTNEGMDEGEFAEAEANIADLLAEYEAYETAEAGDEEYAADGFAANGEAVDAGGEVDEYDQSGEFEGEFEGEGESEYDE